MKTTKILAMFLLLTVGPGLSLTAGEKTIVAKSVLSSGGAVISDSKYRIVGTLGQPFIGIIEGQTKKNLVGFWYLPGEIVTSVVEETQEESLPQEFRLRQNYPNPFNPVTTIQFALPENSQVTLKLFDILGREVAILVDEKLEPGIHKVMFDATGLTSGVYVYRIQSKSTKESTRFVQTKKLLLLK